MKTADENRLSDAELLGQINSLTSTATDTTSGALVRILHLLAQHKDVQAKLQHEIRQPRKENSGENISYGALVSLPYLDAICRATLRLWLGRITSTQLAVFETNEVIARYPGPVCQLLRTVRQGIILPLLTPITGKNEQESDELHVPKGTEIFISILALNTNPELWGLESGLL